MPDFPISDEAVEAVALELVRIADTTTLNWRQGSKLAIQAFLRAEGFEVERSDAMTLWVPDVQASRLVSPWKPENA